MRNRFREPVNGLSHLGAAVAAGIGSAILLYLGRGKPLLQAALFIYGISLVLMFSASSVYHLVIAGPGMSQWLRKLDHSAIYLLIAGTYTPICLRFFQGFWRWGLLAIIWSMAVVGIAIKMLYIRAPRGISAGIDQPSSSTPGLRESASCRWTPGCPYRSL